MTREHKEVITDGLKHDEGKLRYDLIPIEILKALAEIYTYGLKDHTENSWKKVKKSRYVAAFFRHFGEMRSGNIYDDDSNHEHSKHMLWNAATICYLDLKENKAVKRNEKRKKSMRIGLLIIMSFIAIEAALLYYFIVACGK